jgi:hypothetical protein
MNSRPVEVAAFCCLCALTFLAVELARAVYSVNKEIPGYERQVSGLLTDADRTTIIIAGTATNIEKSTRQWKDQSLSQSQAATRATILLNTDLGQLGTLLATANSTLLKQDASLSALEAQAGQSIADTQAQLQPSLLSLSQATTTLAKESGPILQSINDSSAQLVLSSQHIASGTNHIDATTKDVQDVADAFRNDYLKPRNRAWAYFKAIIGIAGTAGNISELAH